MDVWLTQSSRQSMCVFCKLPILAHDYTVKIKVRKKHGNTNWSYIFRYHPQCWIDQGVEALKRRQKEELRGRKRLELSDSQKRQRLLIQVRYGRVKQRLLQEMQKGETKNLDRIITLGSKVEELKQEIEPLGGVPKSWA